MAALVFLLGAASCCTIVTPDHRTEQQWQQQINSGRTGPMELLSTNGLNGWRVSGVGVWQNNEGVLSVERGIGYLYVPITLRDFVLTLEARLSPGANSGVFFRARHPGWGFRPWPVGYEAQLDNNDPENCTGALYNLAQPDKQTTRDGEWIRLRIHAQGNTIRIAVNGTETVQIVDDTYEEGFIALQAHHPTCKVEFRSIRLTSLPW